MSSTPPLELGFRNGLEHTRAGNLNLPFGSGQPDGFMTYIQMQFSDAVTPAASSMSATNDVSLSPSSRHLVNGNFVPAGAESSRRSSGVSPRTIHSRTVVAPYIAGHLDSIPGPTMALSAETAQNQHGGVHHIQPQQNFPRTSVGTMSSLSGSSISSITSITPAQPTTTSQRQFLDIINQICTEAVRRRWQDEVERDLMLSLTPNLQSYLSESRVVVRSTVRYSPYSNNGIPTTRQTRHAVPPPPTPTRGVDVEQGVSIMEYIHRIASVAWERTRGEDRDDLATAGQAEVEVLNYMRTLFVLGSNVFRCCGRAPSEPALSVLEMRDLIAAAGRLCLLLGYREGSARCDQLGRGWAAVV